MNEIHHRLQTNSPGRRAHSGSRERGRAVGEGYVTPMLCNRSVMDPCLLSQVSQSAQGAVPLKDVVAERMGGPRECGRNVRCTTTLTFDIVGFPGVPPYSPFVGSSTRKARVKQQNVKHALPPGLPATNHFGNISSATFPKYLHRHNSISTLNVPSDLCS